MADEGMGPQVFLRELQGMQQQWRIDLKETAVELRENLREVATELRGAKDVLIGLQAQDLGTQLAKLRDVELAAQAKRIEGLERDVIKAHTTIRVIIGVWIVVTTILGIWIAWRQ